MTMKTCPSCGTSYTDNTLIFCLQDGTPLDRMDEVPTVVNTSPRITSPPIKSSNARTAAIAIAATAFLMLAAFGLVAWLYLRSNRNRDDVARNSVNSTNTVRTPEAVNTRVNATATPTKSPTPQPIDEGRIRDEVTDTLDDWRVAAESLDLDAVMSHYAERVDYYNSAGASASTVREDKARAFERYDSMEVKLSNISVQPSETGETAEATVDKEWDFTGDGRSCGKVRQKLGFRHTAGRWLIVSEKDLKVLERC